MGAASSDCLSLLDLQGGSQGGLSQFNALFQTVLLVLFVHVQEKVFNFAARQTVLLEKARRNAQVERLLTFFLLGTFLEAGTFSSQAQLDNLAAMRHVLRADAYDFLHIDSFGSDEATRHLKLLVVRDLNVVTTRIFGLTVPKTAHIFLVAILVSNCAAHVLWLITGSQGGSTHSRQLVRLLLHRHEGERLFEVGERLVHIFLLKFGQRSLGRGC